MRPSTACATTPASKPRQRSNTKDRALVAAGHSGVIIVPFEGKITSNTSHTASMTWISAARSGVSARVRMLRAIPVIREAPAGLSGGHLIPPRDFGTIYVQASVLLPRLFD